MVELQRERDRETGLERVELNGKERREVENVVGGRETAWGKKKQGGGR